jgi:hypothetical protein
LSTSFSGLLFIVSYIRVQVTGVQQLLNAKDREEL